MRALLVAALLVSASPAFALTAVSDEAVAIEAACNGIELGAEQCACIAADAVAGLDAHMRGMVLISLLDEEQFGIRVRSGEFSDEDIDRLIAYQQYVQGKCAPYEMEG